jgi:DNA-directed RNA polymerase subunit M/transcription elongation factor TFIIS
MTTWKLKNCPRCSGDMFVEKDVDGWIERCLLCGYSRDISLAKRVVSTASGTKGKSAARL